MDKLNHPIWALLIKYCFDRIVSAVALILLFPFLLFVACMIKITSTGPVFYRGVRAGYKGVSFRIYKFRTMVLNADKLGGHTTGTNDPRVTCVGAFLRRFKLDEFPQLINVFMADMSFIGPRPEVLEYTDQYIGEEKLILQMRPGITDYSSIKFVNLDDLVGDEDPDEYFRKHILHDKTRLRLKYVKEWSLKLDAYLFLATIWAIIKKIKS